MSIPSCRSTGLRVRLAQPREAAQVADDGRGPLGAALHDVDDLLGFGEQAQQLRRGRRRRSLEAAPQRRHAGGDEADGVVDLVRDAGHEAAERRHLLRLDQLDLCLAQIAQRRAESSLFDALELRGALRHALLEPRVERHQLLVRGGVLQRDGRLVREGTQEVGIAGRVEESRALRPRGQHADQVAPPPERHHHLGLESAERITYPLGGRRVGVASVESNAVSTRPGVRKRNTIRGTVKTPPTSSRPSVTLPTKSRVRALGIAPSTLSSTRRAT